MRPELPDSLRALLETAPDARLTTIPIAGYDWPLYPWTNHDALVFGSGLRGLVPDAEGGGQRLFLDDAETGLMVLVRAAWLVLRKGAPGMDPARRAALDYDLSLQQAENVLLAYAVGEHGGDAATAVQFLLDQTGAQVRVKLDEETIAEGVVAEAADPTATPSKPSKRRAGKAKPGPGNATLNVAPDPTGQPSKASSLDEATGPESSGA